MEVEKPKQTAKLNNWYVEDDCLYGTVSGHPKLADGGFVRTSLVVKLDKETGRATTLNTEYELGSPRKPQDR